MGQKINPLGFRIGVTRDHSSQWFAKPSQYATLLQEDRIIRDYLMAKCAEAGVSTIELHRKADKAASICSYVLLEKNPLLVFELNKHEIFKNHDAVKGGMVHSYCGFPVRNKDGYAMGTFCIFNFSNHFRYNIPTMLFCCLLS